MGLIQEVSNSNRPVLGNDIPLLVFRVFRHFSAGYMEEVLGRGAGVVFQNAGRELGREAGKMLYKENATEYLTDVVQFVRDSKIGILKPVEFTDGRLIVDLDECITCAGMTPIGKRICQFEVGFVAGIVETLTKQRPKAHESLCNMNSERCCQVTVDW